jgi:TRAP-type C4-dicarboxylate transport system permease large subunit
MKNRSLIGAIALIVIFGLSSCEVIGGIFKAGVWVGVLIVVGIIGLIVYLVSRGGKGN